MRRSLSGDRVFFAIVAILLVVGTATFVSAALGLLARPDSSVGRLAFTQLALGLLPGLAAMLALRFAPPALIARSAPWIYGLSIAATLLVFTPLGSNLNGATRWLDVGFTTIQPGEFLKVGVILMLAWYLAKYRAKLSDFRYGLIPFGLIVGVPALILLLEPNTSTFLIIGLAGTLMYILAGAPWRDLGMLALVAIVLLGIVLWMRPYALARVTTFFNPSDNSLTSGYQIQQSLIAIGSGGLIGRGFGQSAQKFNYLPEPDGDSIFAVYSEEFGFIGSVLLLLLFLAFAARGFSIASDSATMFGSLAASGLTLIIACSAFLNIGALLGVLPLTGLPLPFVSHGGTALLCALASVGIILNVAAHKKGKRG